MVKSSKCRFCDGEFRRGLNLLDKAEKAQRLRVRRHKHNRNIALFVVAVFMLGFVFQTNIIGYISQNARRASAATVQDTISKTTKADFDKGTLSSASTTDVSGGEVNLEEQSTSVTWGNSSAGSDVNYTFDGHSSLSNARNISEGDGDDSLAINYNESTALASTRHLWHGNKNSPYTTGFEDVGTAPSYLVPEQGASTWNTLTPWMGISNINLTGNTTLLTLDAYRSNFNVGLTIEGWFKGIVDTNERTLMYTVGGEGFIFR